MATKTTVTPNMVLKTTEKKFRQAVINDQFWAPLTSDESFQNTYGDKAPSNVIVRKTQDEGSEYIEFGTLQPLEGEGKINGAQLLNSEEKLTNYEGRVFFSDVRHGVPFEIKGVDAFTSKDFMNMQQAQKALTTWHKRFFEQAAWQAAFKNIDDKTAAKHGATKCPQYWHPNVYAMETAGLSRVSWNATAATYMTSLSTMLNALGAGDNISYDRIVEAEQAMADNNIQPIHVSYSMGGGSKQEDDCWLWVYPRASRLRLKNALKSVFQAADVRGPGNRAISGDVLKVGKFLFVEGATIPRFNRVDANNITIQESWAVNALTGKRADARTSATLAHFLCGAEALALAEPGALSFQYEKGDYEYRQGIGSYRMYGFKRNDVYDSYTNPTKVLAQHSIVLTEYNG